MKYRIIEVKKGCYPQEKKYFFSKWEYLDNLDIRYTWSENNKSRSIVATYEQALEVIEKRKRYLKDKKLKKIHNL